MFITRHIMKKVIVLGILSLALNANAQVKKVVSNSKENKSKVAPVERKKVVYQVFLRLFLNLFLLNFAIFPEQIWYNRYGFSKSQY